MEKKNLWEQYTPAQLEEMEAFGRDYRAFLDGGKTERECVALAVEAAKAAGYVDMDSLAEQGRRLAPGDKVYRVCMGKSLILFHLGQQPLEQGMNILGAHIDSPRLDVKQNPLYEEGGLAYLDTHYYGGVKKYQWVTIPLALHGVFVKKSGEVVPVRIGEDAGDPVFFVSDLLPHLAQEQMEKKASALIEGEALDLVFGNKPLRLESEEGQEGEKKDGEGQKKPKEAVKAGVLELLRQRYGVEEEDFLSAELEIVPAGPAREAGLDRSMILAYGHDDRVCAYTSLRAQLDVEAVERTLCTLLVDKEEIGSVGATGMESRFFENSVAELMALCGEYSELGLRRALARSSMLSSDVSSAYDPAFASCFDKKNVAHMGSGMVFVKFTGSRGKSGSNDANGEYLASLRRTMEEAGVLFQTAELGRVDLGGGGTIAWILASYGMNVIDSGVAVMNMHAPHEVVSKADVYEAYRGYKAFAARRTAL